VNHICIISEFVEATPETSACRICRSDARDIEPIGIPHPDLSTRAVKFNNPDASFKAAAALNGRFFAGKAIAALYLAPVVFEKFCP